MNALIIEDEKLVAQELINGIATVAPGVRVIGSVSSVKTALRWLADNVEPDLIFADIQLADGISFDVFERFRLTCPIIFTTAYDEYAIRAFKANGIDYLLKPVDPDELKRAIDKAHTLTRSQSRMTIDVQQLVEALSGRSVRATSAYKEHFLGNARNSWVPVQATDIAFFFREQLIFLVTLAGERFVLEYDSLDELELLLEPTLFYRSNRQTIISRNAVYRVKNQSNFKLQVTLKSPNHAFGVDISRDKAPSFKKWLEQ